MKNMKNFLNRPTLRGLIIGLAAATLVSHSAQASPYASAVTNDSGTVRFTMNEAGATVYVVFEDGTTNSSFGVLPKGATNFSLGSHTSYRIFCTKAATGTPALISSDTGFWNATWAAMRGVDVNKNPKLGYLFGRVYIGNAGTNATGKQWGIYALTPDLSTNAFPAMGLNAFTATLPSPSGWTGFWALDANGANTFGPCRMTVAPDNSLFVTDYGTPGGTLWQFGPNFEFTNLVLYPVGENQGIAAGTHGDPIGVAVTGSIATHDLKVYTFDPGLGVPGTAVLGDNTNPNDYNDLYRYDIGAGPLPWSNAPNYAVNVGLPGFWDSQIGDVGLGVDGKLFSSFRRDNLSDGCIQAFNQTVTGFQRVYTSLHDGADVFTTRAPGGANNGSGAYGGVRISPDGRYLATITLNNEIKIANLVNGIPDEGSLLNILNLPTTGNARGIAWDAADNIYVTSSAGGQFFRCYSLGISSTTVYSNDFSGTNGSFQLILPPVAATVVATTPLASQNYVNNTVNPGAPIPGVFTISLDKGHLDDPVTVFFQLTGTAPTNTYTLNFGTDSHGVIIATNSAGTATNSFKATFPAGNYPSGNWQADVQVIPTKTPLVGPTLTVILALSGGVNYIKGTPSGATVSIANTGPQVLVLSAASAAQGPTMNRGIPNDYARFVITRQGDTNGPGNSAVSVNPTAYTVTNFTYLGTAVYPADYTARAQRIDPYGDGVIQVPMVDGNPGPGIRINPGEVTVNADIGNPVKHTIINVPPTNVTVILYLTNAVTGTNLTSAEGLPYSVTAATTTLTEVDNAVGLGGVVLWSNPLTNASDSVNWTLTFGTTNLWTNSVLPVVIRNYTNGTPFLAGGSNNFDVRFGWPITSEPGFSGLTVPPSPVMALNGWTNVLRMTVNKDSSYPAGSGVNVYPQGLKAEGNFALRFDMFLSVYNSAINNAYAGNYPREFAAFGINHYGTNCNWRLNTTIPAGSGCSPTNADGVWFAVDAATGSQTPADFDGFISPPVPNAGIVTDFVSNPNTAETGVFKLPPFVGVSAGGQPINQWVDVSVEVTRQTNCTVFIDRAQVLANFFLTNRGTLGTNVLIINGSPFTNVSVIPTYTNGTIMLGYLDPYREVSDFTAFAYYSNVRVVELSPYILTQPFSLLVTQGADVSFTASANLATAPITNMWFKGTTAATTGASLQTDTANATNLTSTLSQTSVQGGTNYYAVFSDAAGSVLSVPASVEVILTPINQVAVVGTTPQLQVRATGNLAPASFQWRTNGVNLANTAPYGGVTSSNLFLTNVQSAYAGTYQVVVANPPAGTVTQAVTLTTIGPAAAVNRTNLVGTTASFSVTATGPTPTFRWNKNGVNLTDVGNILGSGTSTLTIANLTTNDAGIYSVGVTNGAGVVITNIVLSVILPKFSSVALVGPNALLSYFSPNTLVETTNAWTLQSASVVTGPYVDTAGAYTLSGGTVQVTVPQTGTQMYYRLKH